MFYNSTPSWATSKASSNMVPETLIVPMRTIVTQHHQHQGGGDAAAGGQAWSSTTTSTPTGTGVATNTSTTSASDNLNTSHNSSEQQQYVDDRGNPVQLMEAVSPASSVTYSVSVLQTENDYLRKSLELLRVDHDELAKTTQVLLDDNRHLVEQLDLADLQTIQLQRENKAMKKRMKAVASSSAGGNHGVGRALKRGNGGFSTSNLLLAAGPHASSQAVLVMPPSTVVPPHEQIYKDDYFQGGAFPHEQKVQQPPLATQYRSHANKDDDVISDDDVEEDEKYNSEDNTPRPLFQRAPTETTVTSATSPDDSNGSRSRTNRWTTSDGRKGGSVVTDLGSRTTVQAGNKHRRTKRKLKLHKKRPVNNNVHYRGTANDVTLDWIFDPPKYQTKQPHARNTFAALWSAPKGEPETSYRKKCLNLLPNKAKLLASLGTSTPDFAQHYARSRPSGKKTPALTNLHQTWHGSSVSGDAGEPVPSRPKTDRRKSLEDYKMAEKHNRYRGRFQKDYTNKTRLSVETDSTAAQYSEWPHNQ